MKINFIYNEDKDVDCLMKFGKGSTHSSTQTKVYQELVAFSPNLELSKKITWEFINEYINKNQINVDTYLATYRNDWGDISAEFQKRAEEVFGISLPDEITAYRSSLVNAVIIAEVAGDIGMNDFLLLSKGEAKDTGKARMYILANTYEAFVGAVYLDRGFDIADSFIKTTLLPKLEQIISQKLWRDAKSHIQEKAQEYVGLTPSYKVMQEAGPDHDKHFTVGIYFGEQLIAQGKGKSKQEAEQKSAQEALNVKKWMD